jgi:hypothetical protein
VETCLSDPQTRQIPPISDASTLIRVSSRPFKTSVFIFNLMKLVGKW